MTFFIAVVAVAAIIYESGIWKKISGKLELIVNRLGATKIWLHQLNVAFWSRAAIFNISKIVLSIKMRHFLFGKALPSNLMFPFVEA